MTNRLITKNIIVLAALSLGLSLTACSTASKSHGAAGGGMEAEAGAQTQGIGAEPGFSGTGSNAANRLKAPFNQTYYFDFDRNDVYQNDYTSLDAQAKYLVAHPSAKVQLQGNTDDRGSREYNIGLGWRRARAVQAILEQDGVAPNQIITLSYGAEKPAALGQNEEAWRLNRRVDLVYKSY